MSEALEPEKVVRSDKGEKEQELGPEAIFSEVRAFVQVDPETTFLSILLRIKAKNQTSQPIPLTHPYYLPKISGVFNLRAKDVQRELKTVHLAESDGVIFEPGTVIEPDSEYTWEVSFECRGAFSLHQGRSVAGPYTVAVQPKLGQFLVSKHVFDYEFIFPKPKPKRAWLFRTLHVIHVANLPVQVKVKNRFKETRYKMRFSLGPRDVLRIFVATRYEFSSLVTLVLVVLGTLVAKEVVDLGYDWVIQRLREGAVGR